MSTLVENVPRVAMLSTTARPAATVVGPVVATKRNIKTSTVLLIIILISVIVILIILIVLSANKNSTTSSNSLRMTVPTASNALRPPASMPNNQQLDSGVRNLSLGAPNMIPNMPATGNSSYTTTHAPPFVDAFIASDGKYINLLAANGRIIREADPSVVYRYDGNGNLFVKDVDTKRVIVRRELKVANTEVHRDATGSFYLVSPVLYMPINVLRKPDTNTALTNSLEKNDVISVVSTTSSIKEIVSMFFANNYPVFAPYSAFTDPQNSQMYGYYDMKHIINFIITTGSTIDVIEPNTFLVRFDPSTDNNYYAYTLAKIASLYHVKIVFIGPGAVFGTPYIKQYKYLKPLSPANTVNVKVINIPLSEGLVVSSFIKQIDPIINNKSKDAKGVKHRPKILILTPDEDFTNNLILKLKNITDIPLTNYVSDAKTPNASYILVTHKINDNVMYLGRFDTIIVHAIVEEITIELGKPNVISNDLRPFSDFRILNHFTDNIILITNEEAPFKEIRSKAVTNFTNDGIYDVVTLFSRYNDAYILHNNKIVSKELPAEIAKSGDFTTASKILFKIGTLDNSYRPTDLAPDVLSYSNNIYVGMFYYYWTRSKYDQFPGIVIASFLEQLPILRTSNKDKKYDTSLHEYLTHWNELVAKVKGLVLIPNSEPVKQWCRDKFRYRSQNFIKVIKTIITKCKNQNIKIFGQFTLEGALSRAIPIFDMVYKQFKATLTNNTYLLNGENYSYNYYPTLNKYSHVAILEVENGDPSEISIVIPLSNETVNDSPSKSDGISLPKLELSYFNAYRNVKPQVITNKTLPIKQHTQLKPVNV